MLQETDVDWPFSDYLRINSATKTVCNQTCFEDCFCAVSIFRDNQCWKKKLPLSNGKRDASLGSTAFIKSGKAYFVPPPPTIIADSKSKEKGTISVVLGSVLLGCSLFVLGLIAALFLAFYLMYQKSKGKNKASSVETTLYCCTFNELKEATNDFLWDCFEEKRLDNVVGNDSEALNDIAMVERFAMVGLWCIQENACLRPTMRKVSQMLEGILEVEIPPCPPTFSTTKDLSHVSE